MDNFRRTFNSNSTVPNFGDPITGKGIIDGHEAVDLGLPSGLLWATVNVGGSNTTNYGDAGNYYQWGAGSTTYANTTQYYNGSSKTLPAANDTAKQVWGGGWRMPTSTELNELKDGVIYRGRSSASSNSGILDRYCYYSRKYGDSVRIYFPLAGYYLDGLYYDGESYGGLFYIWGSNSTVARTNYAHEAYPHNTSQALLVNDTMITKEYGVSVRAVHDPI